jgi:hypothetical protein
MRILWFTLFASGVAWGQAPEWVTRQFFGSNRFMTGVAG